MYRYLANHNLRFFIVLILISTCDIAGTNTLTPIWSHFLLTLGGGIETAGTAVACLFVGIGAASGLLNRYIQNHKHYRKWLLGSALLAAGLILCLIFIESPAELYVLEFLIGACMGVNCTALCGLLSLTMSKKYSTLGWGISTFAMYFAIGIGSIIGAHIVEEHSYTLLFLISSAILFLAFLAVFLLNYITPEFPALFYNTDKAEKRFPKKPHIAGLLFAMSLLFAALNMVTPFWSMYVTFLGGDLKSAGYAVGIYFWSYACFNILFGFLEQKFYYPRFYIALSYFLTACSFIAYIFIKNTQCLYLVQILLAFSASMQSPSFDETYVRQLNPQQQTIGQGVIIACYYIAWGAGAFIGSHLTKHFGFTSLFACMAATAFIAFAVIVFVFIKFKTHFTNLTQDYRLFRDGT